jgi:hypothetical protein
MAKICMSRTDFIKEHRKLLKVLKSGDKRALSSEYREQSRELEKYMRN